MATLGEYPLNDVLSMMDMPSDNSGLRWVANKGEEQDPYIYLVLEQAESFGAKAVYFRFFPVNVAKPPRAQIFIYERDDIGSAKQDGPAIHQKLWNAGIVPYCFIYGVSKVLVYNCSKTPSDPEDTTFFTKPHDIINLLSGVQLQLERYSAKKFDSGLFWDSEKGKEFNYNKSAYEQLLNQLNVVKKNIIGQAGQQHAKLVKRLLMMIILIKYLEDRKDEDGISALMPDKYGEISEGCTSLSDILQNHDRLLTLLDALSSNRHFNGRIFSLSEPEKADVRDLDLQYFRFFAEGNMKVFDRKYPFGQMSLWQLYRFSYLPIELISHIYEDFLEDEEGNREEGVVYTPPYLVQFLIDRCMPLNKPKSKFKVLDPACGSGIFLVGAFKRLIQWWRIQHDWQKPTKDNIQELQRLLKDNIYGCDIVEEAVELTYFSLSLALLDALSPKEIWENVHFDNLKDTNLFPGDFFETLDAGSLANDFDLVIGNPPFKSGLTDKAKKIDKAESESLKHPNRPKTPDDQIALLFLDKSFDLLVENGCSCLLLPSGPVLYNEGHKKSGEERSETEKFRRFLFQKARFRTIYDFTPLRTTLFGNAGAKPSVVAVFADNNGDRDGLIHHCIFRRTRASGEKIEFEIDHYDIHPVPYEVAIDSPKVWHANFMGGGRLQHLTSRIAEFSTLADYLEEKKKNHGWKIAEGWIESKNVRIIRAIKLSGLRARTEQEEVELQELREQFKAPWITGHPYLETDSLDCTKEPSIKPCEVHFFYRSSKTNKEIFQPPHLLIKESVVGDAIPVLYSDDYLTFKDKIFGVHSPAKDKPELLRLETYLRGKYNVPLIWLLSGQVLTVREGVPLKEDILALPQPDSDFQINEVEQVFLEDILLHQRDFRINGEKSEILHAPTPTELEAFGEWYCRILNSIYDDFKPAQPIVGNEFIAYPFILGSQAEVEIPDKIKDVEDSLRRILNENQVSDNLWVKRILRVYEKNVIILYKPNQKRYWLRSIAVRDADETFVELFKQGK